MGQKAMNEVAAAVMEHLVNCPKHGYTQGTGRTGDGTTEKIVVGGWEYSFRGGDRDCSAAVISAWQAAGLKVNATYTGDMKAGFLAAGKFTWEPTSFSPTRGDIYLKAGNHAAMYLGDGKLAEFIGNEKGTFTGGQVGDQTGRESLIRNVYSLPWDGILHFKGGEATGGICRTVPAQMWTPNNTKAQNLTVKWIDSTHVTLTACDMNLDVSKSSKTRGATVQFCSPITGSPGQIWKVITHDGPYKPGAAAPIELAPKCNESLRLDVKSYGKTAGTPLITWTATGGKCQQFAIVDRGGGVWTLIGVDSTLAVDVKNAGA